MYLGYQVLTKYHFRGIFCFMTSSNPPFSVHECAEYLSHPQEVDETALKASLEARGSSWLAKGLEWRVGVGAFSLLTKHIAETADPEPGRNPKITYAGAILRVLVKSDAIIPKGEIVSLHAGDPMKDDELLDALNAFGEAGENYGGGV
jgi:hypothetical protein